MNEAEIIDHRGRCIKAVREAVRPGGEPVTAERQQGEILGLLSVAATIFLAQQRIPPDGESLNQATTAALRGLENWLGTWRGRH